MRLIKSAALGLAVVFLLPVAVSAQEIEPDPGSYQYGSTSEFSASSTLEIGSSDSDDDDTLADTGSNVAIVFAGSAALIIGSGIMVKRKLLA